MEKIEKLTPNQVTRRQYYGYKKFAQNKDYQLLNETKTLHNKKSHFSKVQIKEFSILSNATDPWKLMNVFVVEFYDWVIT